MDYILPTLGVLLAVWFVARLVLRGKRILEPTLGALNLVGPAAAELLRSDVEILGKVFTKVQVSDGPAPTCDVLLLYGNLAADGRIEGSGASLREIIRDSGASIAVVASENSSDALRGATKGTSLWGATLVLTMDRKGTTLARFLKRLFDKMANGRPMAMAWNDIAPQVPGAHHDDLPDTFCAMELGHISFGPTRRES